MEYLFIAGPHQDCGIG